MQDLQVHVAAQRVDEVVAADRQHVAVAADDPHVRSGRASATPVRDRGRAAVDAVHAVGVHVVRQPGRAPDAGDEHQVSRASRRARAAATGSRRGSRSRRSRGTSGLPGRTRSPCGSSGDCLVSVIRIISRILASISAARNGTPCILVSLRVDQVLGPDEARRAGRGSSRARAPCGSCAGPRRGRAGTGSGGRGARARPCGRAARTRRTAAGDRTPRAAPAEHEHLGAVVVVEVDAAGCRWRCRRSSRPAAAPSCSWFSGS